MWEALLSVAEYPTFVAYCLQGGKDQGTPKGALARLAQALGCHPSFVNQVIRGRAHLSPDQAVAFCEHYALGAVEKEYFCTLVLRDRAGKEATRRFYGARLEELKLQKLDLARVLSSERKFTESDEIAFFGNWQLQAMHSLAQIPRFQTIAALAEALGLSKAGARGLAQTLAELRLVELHGEKVRATDTLIHLRKDSPALPLFHGAWRARAMQEIAAGRSEETLHFSSLLSISEKDASTVRALFVDLIAELRRIATNSKEEAVYSLGTDFYRLSRG